MTKAADKRKARDNLPISPTHRRAFRRERGDARSYPVDKLLRGSIPAARGAKVKL